MQDKISVSQGRDNRARSAIQAFLQDRLQSKLDKLPDDDPKRTELIAQHQPAVWVEDAARRVAQIQAVTHSLKPIHPDARGTNLYVSPSTLAAHNLVGSHVLGDRFVSDVVGNAAALDVYKFLRLEVDGRSLLDWLLADDPDVLRALSDDPDQARQWRAAFVGLVQGRDEVASSHSKAKQLYWLTGGDASDDTQYHLLAPLYATSLAHSVHGVLNEDRYGETNKAAREARNNKKPHDGVHRVYPALAVQKLGGTKPQNISQLNSERGGVNYLLGSLPPQWQSRPLPQPWNMVSIFDHLLLGQEDVRQTVQAFLRFLQENPPANIDTADRVDAYVSSLIDHLVSLSNRAQHAWPDGWTADSRCTLVRAEQLWLDPMRCLQDEAFYQEWQWMDWPEQIGHRFGNWLNAQLDGALPVGEIEHRQWKKELLLDESEGGWAQQLHEWRTRLKTPHWTPTRQGSGTASEGKS